MKTLQKKNVSIDRLNNNRRITRSMSLENERDNSLPIPDDLIIIIFSMLPLKSIARCRCVSKFWASILRRSDFTELFSSMSRSRGPKLLFSFHNKSKLFFSSPHPQNPAKNLSRVVINYQMKFCIGFGSYFDNSDLVNGLICLYNRRILNGKEEIVLKICNPSTGQTLNLPKVKTSSYCMWIFFGYEPIDKDYKVLVMANAGRHGVMCAEFQVLTIGIGNLSWRMVECCVPHNPPEEKICIDGVLYYTSIDWRTKTCTIVCFDIRFEKFTFIKVIETIKEVVLDVSTHLVNYNGKLGFLLCEDDVMFVFFGERSIKFKLWVLEDLKKQEWSEHTFVFPTVPKNIAGEFLVNFVGMTKEKEIVLSSGYPFYLFYLNLEKKTIVRVKIQGMDAANYVIDHIFLDHVENVKLYGSD